MFRARKTLRFDPRTFISPRRSLFSTCVSRAHTLVLTSACTFDAGLLERDQYLMRAGHGVSPALFTATLDALFPHSMRRGLLLWLLQVQTKAELNSLTVATAVNAPVARSK